MPVEWEREGSVFVVRAIGWYTPAQLAENLDEILALRDFPANAGILLDVRRSESLLKRSPVQIREITKSFADRSDRFDRRCALLVEGLLRYGLMRMASSWASVFGVDAGVFRDPERARAWARGTPLASSGPR